MTNPSVPVNNKERVYDRQWKLLTDERKFTGEHRKWHEDLGRRVEVARRMSRTPLPPPISLTGPNLPRSESRSSWGHSPQLSLDDPSVVDTIGVTETIELAKERVESIGENEELLWHGTQDPNSEDFAQTMALAKARVMEEVASLWSFSEWHAGWFDRACREKITKVLDGIVRTLVNRARKHELKRLSPPKTVADLLNHSHHQTRMSAAQQAIERGKRTLEEGERSRRQRFDEAFAEYKRRMHSNAPVFSSASSAVPHGGIEDRDTSSDSPDSRPGLNTADVSIVALEFPNRADGEKAIAAAKTATLMEGSAPSAAIPSTILRASDSTNGPTDGPSENSSTRDLAIKREKREAECLAALKAKGEADKRPTAVTIYKRARQDKSEYYRWRRGELPDGCQADQRIRDAIADLMK